MKFKTLLILILSGLITQAHAQRLGGNSGGGGNIKPPTPLNEWTLKSFIEGRIPHLVTWHFNAMHSPFVPIDQKPAWLNFEGEQFGDYGRAIMEETYRKMFLEKETIFDRIPLAKIKVQKEKCIDPVTHEERAASANAETNEICFSSSEIIAATPAEELRSYILGLALHEYSHLRGTTEEEADMIQHFGRTMSAVDGPILGSVESLWNNRRYENSGIPEATRLLEEWDTMSEFRLGLSLISLELKVMEDINRMNTFIHLSGLSPWSMKQRVDAITAQIKAGNIRSVLCSIPSAANTDVSEFCHPTDMAMGLLTKGNSVAVEEIFQHLGTRLAVDPKWKIRYLKFGDREAIQAELKELLEILTDLFPAKKPEIE